MFTKQTLVAIFSNHAEIVAIHEIIRGTSGLRFTTQEPTCIYEDNVACIKLMKQSFIKGDNTKYIQPKYFYNQQQQTLLKIQMNQVKFEENVANLFTKCLPKSTFEKHVKNIDMLKLYEIPLIVESGGGADLKGSLAHACHFQM